MKQAHLRFYGELNDFLPPSRKYRTTAWAFDVSGSVKDVIEAIGVPHTEVDLILANGESVGFSYRVQDEDRISVYPAFESIDISPVERLRPEPLRALRFVADAHLGRLAAYLRMAGFDTVYQKEYEDEEVARISSTEGRVLLTRDRGVLKRNVVARGYWVRATDPREQLAEVIGRFDLRDSLAPFERCVHCNALLQPVQKEKVSHRLLPETLQYYDEFSLCPACDHIYWKGSHYRRMQKFIESIVGRANSA
jgi:uncharacterized protein with PIN domain